MLDYVLDIADTSARLANAMLADVSEDKVCYQPVGLPNHPLWCVGHITTARSFVCKTLGANPDIPENFVRLFARDTVPSSDASRYPSAAEVLRTFQTVHGQLKTAIRATPQARLSHPNPIDRLRAAFPTLGHLIVGVLTLHDGLHLGQISDWRRAMGLPRIMQ